MESTAPTVLYGRLTSRQRDLVARIQSGEDVRFYSPGVNHTTAYSLMSRRIAACEAATCRFRLLPPEQAIRRLDRKGR